MPRASYRAFGARARFLDGLGRYAIAIGGISIIAAVLAIFAFIAREALPLFQRAGLQEGAHFPQNRQVLAAALDPYGEVVLLAGKEGVEFLRLGSGESLGLKRPAMLDLEQVICAWVAPEEGWLGLGLEKGSVLVGRYTFDIAYDHSIRSVTPALVFEDPLELTSEGLEKVVVRHDGEGRLSVAGITALGKIALARREQKEGLLGPGPVASDRLELSLPLPGKPTALLVNRAGSQVLVGTDQGEMGEWQLGDLNDQPVWQGSIRVSTGAVTALGYVLGENTVLVGDAAGQVLGCFKTGKGKTYKIAHRLQAHPAAVSGFAASARDRQFLSADVQGNLALHHMTSGQTFFQLLLDQSGIAAMVFSPKADGLLLVGNSGEVRHFGLDNPHPEITAGTLFGKIWYEGYEEPAYVWQSTGGSDDFEPKFSLVPLIFGTIKGTFYALFLALPLAVLAALYTAEFASPSLRTVIKPAVEVMASLPSVILGLMAGLWLAPLLEQGLAGVFVMLPLLPLLVLGAVWVKRRVPGQGAGWLTSRVELGILVGLVLLGGFLAFGVLGPLAEQTFLGGSMRQWLAASVKYEQRNSLVVGFAMGFAVVPLIFTICEDALSTVPTHLRAGSLALGATPWQTAVRVVLPMALPGIFSATMIGFGRAVGETMIVLMATGNTPIMDWSLFNGMRAISANIAVELPEAPFHSSLYRVLFLSGLLLFGVTFFINTLAELVRQRLRDKYSKL